MSQLPTSQKKLQTPKAQSQPQKGIKIFNNQFIVKKKISSGSFGVVFLGEDKITNLPVALKIERDESDEVKSLDRETHILSRLQGIPGVPKLYWHGSENCYNIMVLQLLGRDLAYYLKVLKKFSLKTVLMIAEQLIQIIEQMHNRSVVHRDLKPENILVGYDDDELSKIFIVDYGISKFYRDSQGNHISQKDGKPFIGTTRYASINAHKGIELARADDLESIAYIMIFLYKGQLPWQNMQHVSDKDKTKAVGEMKMKIDTKFADFLKILRK